MSHHLMKLARGWKQTSVPTSAAQMGPGRLDPEITPVELYR